METAPLPAEVVRRLGELFTRCYISAATYVADAGAYEVPDDAPLLERIRAIQARDREHARLLASVLRMADHVPEPGVFPYWHRDLNYLTVPYLAGFVVESLATDLARIDAALAVTPADLTTVQATLRMLRTERAALFDDLAPRADAARRREAQAHAAASRAIRETREARLAAERAEADAARKAAAAAKRAAPAPAAAAPAPPPAVDLPDPDEPGLTAKEKARRTMLRKRAAAQGAPAPAAAPAPVADLPDPDEPGLTAKEKARRTMMIKRAAKQAEPPEPG